MDDLPDDESAVNIETPHSKNGSRWLRFTAPSFAFVGVTTLCVLVFLYIFPRLALNSDTSMIKQNILPRVYYERCHIILTHQQLMVTDRKLGTIWGRLPAAWHRDPGGPRTQHFAATHWREIPYVGRMRSHSEYQNEKDPKRILMTNTVYVQVPGCET